MADDKELTFTGHLTELRHRLLLSVIALVITTLISFVFINQIFVILIAPAGDIKLIFIEMTEMLATYMKVALACGIILAMPFLVYQLFGFVSPALMKKEKRYIYISLPFITVMFAGGIVFAYFILLPPATRFLLSFGADIAEPQIKIGNYVSIVSRLLVAMGCVFEMPAIIFFLSWIGAITPQFLRRKFRLWVVIAFILSAIITPTFDPVNQSLVAGPLIALYVLSIGLAKVAQRLRQPQMASYEVSSVPPE